MEQEKVRKTFRQIFRAEILVLIGLLINAVSGSFFSTAADAYSAGVVEGGTLVTGTVLSVLGGLLVIIGGIMRITAISKGRKLNRYLGFAFAFTILVFVLSIASNVIGSGYLSVAADRLSDIMGLVIAICIIQAILSLSKASGNAALTENAQKTAKLFTLLAVTAVCADTLIAVVTAGGSTAVIFGIAYMALVLIAYVMYLKLVIRASVEL